MIKYSYGLYPVKSPDKSGDITVYRPQVNNRQIVYLPIIVCIYFRVTPWHTCCVMRFMPYTDSVLSGENWQGEIEAAVKIVDRYSTSSVNLLSSPHFAIDTNWLIKSSVK